MLLAHPHSLLRPHQAFSQQRFLLTNGCHLTAANRLVSATPIVVQAAPAEVASIV